MKKHNYILMMVILLMVSCARPGQESTALPEDLPTLKKLQKEAKAEIRATQLKLDSIELKIAELDPNVEEKKRLVTSQKIALSDFKKYATIQGMVTSDDIVNASSETGGRLTSMVVKEGQYVRKGQLIATIDMESVNKQIAEIEKSLELARSVYERQDRLWKQNIGSEIQYLQAKNNKERLEKTLETVKFQLTKANVYAPISGVVDREFLMAGEMSSPGGPIVQILNTYNVKVVADVPENYLISTKRGQKVDVYFPALDEERKASITLLGRSIDPANRTFKIEIKANNRNGKLKPNLLAEVKINDFTEKDVIVVPLELVQQEVGGKSFVYTVGNSDKGLIAEKQYVETGESYDGNVIISKGLTEDMEVIIDGARNLTRGELIEIKNPTNESQNG